LRIPILLWTSKRLRGESRWDGRVAFTAYAGEMVLGAAISFGALKIRRMNHGDIERLI
jgi:hypothetical protein